jgi:hypothetical protein
MRTPVLALLLCTPFAVHAQTRSERRPLQRVRGGISAPVCILGPLREGTRPEKDHPIRYEEENFELLPEPASRAALDRNLESLLAIRTPGLTTQWPATSNNGGIDPQIAVSNDLVGVLTWDQIAFYDKSGTLLPATAAFPNPTNTETLFGPMVDSLDQDLNLAPAAASDPSFLLKNGGNVGDARIAFDPQRHRFLIAGTAKNAGQPVGTLSRSQRRTKFLFAISRTADPADGWSIYAFNGTPNDGACGSTSDAHPCPNSSFTPGDAGDYPSIGISSAHYILTVHVNHMTVSDGTNNNKTAYIVTLNAAAAAAGAGGSALHGHGFWAFDNPKLNPSDAASPAVGVIAPVIQRAALSPEENFLVQPVSGRLLAVYTVSAGDPPNLKSAAVEMGSDITWSPDAPSPGGDLKWSLTGWIPTMSAYLRNGRLTTAFADCVRFSDMESGTCATAIHLVRLQVSQSAVSLGSERIFGERNPLDEPEGTVNWYGYPAPAENKHGDLIIAYHRTGPSLAPEARYTAWMHGEAQQRPSNVLQAGTGNLPSGARPDTGGVSVDPFDDTGIWMAHLYAKNGAAPVAVGKVFGEKHADLAVSDVSFFFTETSALHVEWTVADRGDAPAGRSSAAVSLVCARDRRLSLGKIAVEELRPGETRALQASVALPKTYPPGPCRVHVEAALAERAAEYSLANNGAFATGDLNQNR